MKRDFDSIAPVWDADPRRQTLASDISEALLASLPLTRSTRALELGCGTGLVTLNLARAVGSLLATDQSGAMLQQVRLKADALGITNVSTALLDADESGPLAAGSFDLVFGSMMLHHVKDVAGLMKAVVGWLKPGGFAAFADAETEDGSFHDDNTGVFHFGLSHSELRTMALYAGLSDVKVSPITKMVKNRDGISREYGIIVVMGQKQID